MTKISFFFLYIFVFLIFSLFSFLLFVALSPGFVLFGTCHFKIHTSWLQVVWIPNIWGCTYVDIFTTWWRPVRLKLMSKCLNSSPSLLIVSGSVHLVYRLSFFSVFVTPLSCTWLNCFWTCVLHFLSFFSNLAIPFFTLGPAEETASRSVTETALKH